MQQEEEPLRFYKIAKLRQFENNCMIVWRKLNEDTFYTYGECIKAVQQLVQQFEELHIPKKGGIALHLPTPHTPATCILLLSVLEHNCYFCPLESKFFEDQLDGCGAQFLITNQQQTDYTFLQSLQVFEEQFYVYKLKCLKNEHGFDFADLCYCLQTSGSTGKAKTVHVPITCIAPNIQSLSTLFEITSQDVIYFATPLTFDPSVVEFLLAIRNGATLLLRHALTDVLGALFPKGCKKRGISVMQLTPSNLRLFGLNAIRNVILAAESSLRILILGGEEFPRREELLQWHVTNKRLFNIYGITELSCWSTCHEYVNENTKEKRVPLGKPLDNETLVRLVIPHTNVPLNEGESQGELQVGSATRRCWLHQDEDSKVQTTIYRSTGDLVEIDANANLYYLERLNRVIKRHGKRLCLDGLGKHIESILNKHFGKLVEAVCLWQDKLICVLVLHESTKLQQNRARSILTSSLAKHNIPDCYMFLPQLPLNAHGKLDTRQLLTIWRHSAIHVQKPTELFCQFLSQTLAMSDTSDKGLSFYAAGGTSFQALSLATEIGNVLAAHESQRQLLQMLLDSRIKIGQILSFLQTCETKAMTTDNTKLLTSNNPIKQCWRVDLQKCVDSAPAGIKLANGQHCICVGSHAHILLTLDAYTGDILARLELPDRIESQVVFPSMKKMRANMALVGCYDGYVYAFNYLRGYTYWSINAGGMIKARPLLLPRTNCVVIASYGEQHNLMCVCLETQQVVWRRKLGDKGIFSTPLLLPDNENSLLVCTLSGIYARLSVKCGSIEWQHECQSPIFSTATCFLPCSSLMTIAEVSGSVHFCNTSDGHILDTFKAEGNIFSGISVVQLNEKSALIIFGCHDKCLYCLRYEKCKTIELAWKVALKSAIYATPKLVSTNEERFVLACTTKGQIALISLDSRQVEAAYELNGEVFSTPYCSNEDYFYIGCRDNFLYCFAIP